MTDLSESEGNDGSRDVEMGYVDSYFTPGEQASKLSGSTGLLKLEEQSSSGQVSPQPGAPTQAPAEDCTSQGHHTPASSASSEPVLPRIAMKKKGTAATKKGPGRKKGPKSAAPKQKKAKAAAAAKNTGAAEGDDDMQSSGNDDDGDDDDEIDNGPYCICRGPDDHRWMIGCDICEDWFHGECVNIDKKLGEKLIERFVCPNCSDENNYTKFKKTCSWDKCTDPARLNPKDGPEGRSVFCSREHCDKWWASMIGSLPTNAASKGAVEVLTQEDFMGLLVSTAEQGDWKLGNAPFGNVEGLWANGLPTQEGVLSHEEEHFLKSSAAERLALGNEMVQYKKMMQVLDWNNERRQRAIEQGRFTKDSCGYDDRCDTVTVRRPFMAWLDGPDGQATFAAGRLDAPLGGGAAGGGGGGEGGDGGDAATRGMCEKKRCKSHAGWYKIHMTTVRVLIKEAATTAAEKLGAEEALRQAAESRLERRKLENNWVEAH